MAVIQTFGRYQLHKKLATGGMGEVFLARQKGPSGFEKMLVVKRILPHLSEEEEFIQMFFDEARIAAHLNHPNIAQIFEMGEVDGIYYIAMEYLAGESVRSVNTRAMALKGRLPIGLCCRIFADAAAGLDFAHHAKSPSGSPLELIHRDVSPQNILVGYNGGVKLIDFGVAKAANKLSSTATGTVKGKYAYMSPEQARGEDLDGRSDLYGLATVFWETLTGYRLWKRESEVDTMKAVVKEKAPPPSSLAADIPKELDAILAKALSKKRTERYDSCGAFQLALEDFVVEARMPATNKHLSAFMQEMFAEEIDANVIETTGIHKAPEKPVTKTALAASPNLTTGSQSKVKSTSGKSPLGASGNAATGSQARVKKDPEGSKSGTKKRS